MRRGLATTGSAAPPAKKEWSDRSVVVERVRSKALSLSLSRYHTVTCQTPILNKMSLFLKMVPGSVPPRGALSMMMSSWLRRLTLPSPAISSTTSAITATSNTAQIAVPYHRPVWQEALWLAVPKKKVTRHKKRLKTTVQKRIKLRRDIITDPRTGETTLRHKMPFNWKKYLPTVE